MMLIQGFSYDPVKERSELLCSFHKYARSLDLAKSL